MLRTLRARDKQPDPTIPKQPDTKADNTISKSTPQNTSEPESRFWNETSTPILPTPAPIHGPQKSSSSSYRKPSIAAATIIGVLVLAAITFLTIYYIRREKRARRLHRLQKQSQEKDPFGRSSLSLTAETSKTLDDFLMKDVLPERASLMFSRSPSPSVTFVVDETKRASNCNSYNASATSLHKIETLARVSNDRTRWSSHSSSSFSRETQAMLQSAGMSPRASMSSTRPPTGPSSRLSISSPDETILSITTTTESSLQTHEPTSPRPSQSNPGTSSIQKTPSRPDSGIFLLPSMSGSSRSSHASSRLSAPDVARTDPKAINKAGGLRRSDARSRSHSLSQSNISPIAESLPLNSGSVLETGSALGSSLQLSPDRSTPSPMFRLSEG